MSIRKSDFNPLNPSEGIEKLEELTVSPQKGPSKTTSMPSSASLTGLLPGQGRPDSALDGLLRHRDYEEEHLMGDGPDILDARILQPTEWFATAASIAEDLGSHTTSDSIQAAQQLLRNQEGLMDDLADALNALKKG